MKRPLKAKLVDIIAILFSLALPLIIISCTYEETFQCDQCRETFSEKYMVHDFDLNYVCLSCIDEQMLDIGFERAGFCNGCDEYYSLSDLNSFGLCERCIDKMSSQLGCCHQKGFGLCESCSDEMLSECFNCGDLDFSWSDESEYFLCRRCIASATQNPDVLDSLISSFE